jgi:5-methyltetrahydrofolate--homocysteine methyltransferase
MNPTEPFSAEGNIMGNMGKIAESILTGDSEAAVQHTLREMENGIPWAEILQKAMIPTMERIGEDFSKGLAFLPELIAAGHAMSQVVEMVKARSGQPPIEPKGTMILGTIFGDVHDIGKNIVKMNFEGAGFKVIDLGVDVSAASFVQACRANKARLVGISALLSTTMLHMEEAIKRLRTDVPGAKIILGGAPLNEEYAKKLGADGYAADGYQGVQKAKELLEIQ